MTAEQLRILQVSTADLRGGAEQAAMNLHHGLLSTDIRSSLCVGVRATTDPTVWTLPNERFRHAWARSWDKAASRFESRALRGLRWVGDPKRWIDIHRGHEDLDHPGAHRLLDLAPFRPRLVHLHNLHGGYFDLRALPRLTRSVPTVITLHDAWLLSGHCAHSFSCERWKIGCGECPDLTIYPAVVRDATSHNWILKRDIFAVSRLNIATPSRWLMEKMEASMLANARIDSRVIPYGIDLDLFSPGDQKEARIRLGLPQDARILLFVGNVLTSNQFKDYGTLLQAIARLDSDGPIILICLGQEQEPARVDGVEIRFAGPVAPSEVADYYRSCDVYVHAALEDTFPLSILEALASGRPVVGSAVGGIPEQIRDAADPTERAPTGYLVPPQDPLALARVLDSLLADAAVRRFMGDNARHYAEERFGLARYVSDHIQWYQEILDRDRASAG